MTNYAIFVASVFLLLAFGIERVSRAAGQVTEGLALAATRTQGGM